MDHTSLGSRAEKHLCPTYSRYPLAVKRAEGCRLYDFQDREYVDLLAGISVCNLGHSHPEIVETLKKQAEKLIHVSNLFFQEEQVQLAEELARTCVLDKAFFCNSGAEANEAAIKLMRRYMHRTHPERFELLTFTGSFHGRSLATLTATGQDKIKEGFGPLPPGFRIVPLNDPQALEEAVTSQTAGIMMECIQGESGVQHLSQDFVAKIKELQEKHSILLIVDEIQTGLARTGAFWAHELLGLNPDMITSAKSLAGGLPMGALMSSEELAGAFDAGSHGTTFGGGPLASATALKSLEILQRENLVQKSREDGAWAMELFREIQREFPGSIQDVRGSGLMLGIELTFPGKELWTKLLHQGFVLNLTQERVLRLLPPLTISRQDIQDFARTLKNNLSRM